MNRKERKWPGALLALGLNLFFFPLALGFIYLKNTRRLLVYSLVGFVSAMLYSFLFWVMPESTWGKTHWYFVLGSSLLYIVVIAGDTLFTAIKGQPVNSSWLHHPRVWLFALAYIAIFTAASLLIEKHENPFFKAHNIPTASMEPNIQVGDFIFANQVFDRNKLNRGDIIVFQPQLEKLKDYLLVKRIIGKPGDLVVVRVDHIQRRGLHYYPLQLYINQKKVPRRIVQRSIGSLELGISFGQRVNKDYLVVEETHGPKKIMVLYTALKRRPPGRQILQLGKDQYFVLGDNRDNSLDSRTSTFGPVKQESIQGVYAYTYYSMHWHDDKCNQDAEINIPYKMLKRLLGNCSLPRIRAKNIARVAQ